MREGDRHRAVAKVVMLFEGYYFPGAPARACSTVVLVRDGEKAIIVDPGTVPDPGALLQRLACEGLAPNDVNMVIITHAHTDHFRQAGLFPAATLLDAWGSWEGDLWRDFGGRLSPDIELVPTPGHSNDSLTVFVHTGEAEIAICGDVIYREAAPIGPPQGGGGNAGLLDAGDPFADDPARLRASRQLVLERADFVVPGHGPMFKVHK